MVLNTIKNQRQDYIEEIQNPKDITKPLFQNKRVKDYFCFNEWRYTSLIKNNFKLDLSNYTGEFIPNKSENDILDNFMNSEKLLLDDYMKIATNDKDLEKLKSQEKDDEKNKDQFWKDITNEYKLSDCVNRLRGHILDLVQDLLDKNKKILEQNKILEQKNRILEEKNKALEEKNKILEEEKNYNKPILRLISKKLKPQIPQVPGKAYPIIKRELHYKNVSGKNYLSIEGVPFLDKLSSSNYTQDLINFHLVLNGLIDYEGTYFSNTMNPLILVKIKYCNIKDIYYVKNGDSWKIENINIIYTTILEIILAKFLEIDEKLKGIVFTRMDFEETCKQFQKRLDKVKTIVGTDKFLKEYLENNKNKLVKGDNKIDESDFKNPELYKRFITDYIKITKNPKDRINKKICLEKFTNVFFPNGGINNSIVNSYRSNIKKILTKLTNDSQDHHNDYWGCTLK